MAYSSNFISKLKESGLSTDDAERLKFGDLSPEQTQALHSGFKKLQALKIPYFSPDGLPLKDSPNFKDCEDYFRIRYLGSRPGFYKQVDKKAKYHQKSGTKCAAYYPRNLAKSSWPEIIQDPNTPLLLTEGEFKAAKACKEGYPTIGIAGVWNWCSRKDGQDLIPSLACVNFVRRDVYICYDSDYKTNPQVLAGLKELSVTLERYGAYCHLVTIPSDVGGNKCGLDDFLVGHGSEGAKILSTLLELSVPMATTEALFSLNSRYCYVSHPSAIVDCKVNRLLKKDHFKDAVQNIYYMSPQLNKEGETKYKPAPVGNPWLVWPLRNQADIIVYEPGEDAVVTIQNRGRELTGYNTWGGWGCEALDGDVSHFRRFVDYLFGEASPEHKHWFLQWLAYPLQHPGTKLLTAVVLQGVQHGTGKTMLGYTMREIYGVNFMEIKQRDIDSPFNEWAVDKSFILADELTGSKQRLFSDTLKSFITQREVSLNRKNLCLYSITDHMNYLFTSNHPDAFYLEDSDRRFFIMTVPSYLLPEDFYKTYEKKYLRNSNDLSKGKEISHVFHYLLNYDLSGFNPSGHAPRTTAKETMSDLGLSDLGLFLRGFVKSPDAYAESCCDLLRAKDILAIYKASEDVSDNSKRSITVNGIARELSAMGIPKANKGNAVHLDSNKAFRYYIIRNQEKWEKALHVEVVEYLASFDTEGEKKKKFE